jgi:hypothetical protein
VVASTSQTPGGNRNPELVLPFNNNNNEATNPDTPTEEIQEAIQGLKVFEPVNCDSAAASTSSLGGCLRFLNDFGVDYYAGVDCLYHPAAPNDQSTCGSSNFGGSLYMAGKQFDNARQEAFWVAIALIGGPATATDSIPGKPTGFCPQDTWPTPFPGNGRGCRDFDTISINAGFNSAAFDWETDATRHSPVLAPPAAPVFPANYDADDYARDGADFITSPDTGQGATIYSICLGSLCRGQDALGNYTVKTSARADPWSGDHLGEYMAEHSGGTDANHGLYYYASGTTDLSGIFSDIANNIFTRISQ